MNNNEQNNTQNNIASLAIGATTASLGFAVALGSAAQVLNGYNTPEEERFYTATAIGGATAMIVGSSLAHNSAAEISNSQRRQIRREERLGTQLREANQRLENSNEPTIAIVNAELSDASTQSSDTAPKGKFNYKYESDKSKLELETNNKGMKYSFKSKENDSEVKFNINSADATDLDDLEPEAVSILLKTTAKTLRKVDNQNEGLLDVELRDSTDEDTSLKIKSSAKPKKHADIFEKIAESIEMYQTLDGMDSGEEPELHAKRTSSIINTASDAISEILLASQTANSNEKSFASQFSQTNSSNSSFVERADEQRKLERSQSL